MRHVGAFLLLTVSLAHAQLTAPVDAYGRLPQILLGGRLVGQDLQVRVVKRGWGGELLRQGDPAVPLTATDEQGARVFRGQFPVAGGALAFAEWVAATPREVRLRWQITPSVETAAECIAVFVSLPVAGNAGQGSFLTCDGEIITEKPLPAELPNAYHLAGGSGLAWCGWALSGGTGLQFVPDAPGRLGLNFQDDRQFGTQVFEAQFAVPGTAVLKAGQTYAFGLTLRPFTQAAQDAARQAAIDPQKVLAVPLTSSQPLKLSGLRLSAPTVPVYEKLELTLDLSATFDNPFDPADVDVTASFSGPGGKHVTVPGFYYQDYEWYGKQPHTRLRTVGQPVWKVRFAPPVAGKWTVRVAARDRSGQVQSPLTRFTAVAGKSPGYIRRSPDTPYYLQFDNGQPYFPIGENICWPPGTNDDLYATWFKALGAAGGNYCRVWLVRWNMALEWQPDKGNGTYYGLGKYALDNAYRLDWVLSQARANGIHPMLCLGYHGELMDTKAFFGENCWDDNPYNQANGGPCARPAEFWTNERARRLYQQRLRYYLARYAWDPQINSWELWNEVNAPAPWVKEMAGYLQANDPNRHLVTTTYGNQEVWELPEMDYVQDHNYGSGEGRPRLAAAIADQSLRYTRTYRKPFQVGEFGTDWKTSDANHDPKGLGTSLHDGLWASVMTRGLGTAAIWYWDGYVHPFNLYHEYTSIKRFVAGVNWNKWAPELAQFGPALTTPDPATPWGDVVVTPDLGWAKQPAGEYVINADGTTGGNRSCAAIVFSPAKADLVAPLRFRVTYPRAGQLVLHVNQVSQGAVLHVAVDGTEVFTQDLPCGEGQGPWKTPKFNAQYQIWQNFYDQDYTVPIPAGEHVVEISNTGKDWAEIGRYTFVGVRDPRYAALDQYGLRDDRLALLWLHDQESNWFNDKYNRPPRLQRGLRTTLRGLGDGRYRLEWWDTRAGRPVLTTAATSQGGELPIAVPDFTRDLAAKVTRER